MQPPEPFSFALTSILIIWQSGEICKENFFDKAEVKRTALLLVRRGEVVCALCSGELAVHGCYPRHCRDEEGKRHYGWIAQARCDGCKAHPSLIPSFIRPHKHYEADVIERVVEAAEAGSNVEDVGGCAADTSTMRRWVREFKERGAWAVGCLAAKLPPERKSRIGALDLPDATLLQQLVRLLREHEALGSGGVISNANIILSD